MQIFIGNEETMFILWPCAHTPVVNKKTPEPALVLILDYLAILHSLEQLKLSTEQQQKTNLFLQTMFDFQQSI